MYYYNDINNANTSKNAQTKMNFSTMKTFKNTTNFVLKQQLKLIILLLQLFPTTTSKPNDG